MGDEKTLKKNVRVGPLNNKTYYDSTKLPNTALKSTQVNISMIIILINISGILCDPKLVKIKNY